MSKEAIVSEPVAESVALEQGFGDVAILTGGGDRPYALGLADVLLKRGIRFDFIGSDDLQSSIFRSDGSARFLNLRGDQNPDASALVKVWRVAKYYARLFWYALTSKARIFHILWNNRWEFVDRTVLMTLYKALGKRVVLTAHNANKQKRDGRDSRWNRMTLGFQYRLADHIFVHTERMKHELQSDFSVSEGKVSVIPFGLNNTVPVTALSREEARNRLGLGNDEKVLLFFGNIAPYKGLEYLIEALGLLKKNGECCRLVIAGQPKGPADYWEKISRRIEELALLDRLVMRIEYVSDEETEVFFKAADVVVLPYTHIFQSGVLFLGYSFGLPVIASDVGSLRDDIIIGRTGCVCKPCDAVDLARSITEFFRSEMYFAGNGRRAEISEWAQQRNSWDTVADLTVGLYTKIS